MVLFADVQSAAGLGMVTQALSNVRLKHLAHPSLVRPCHLFRFAAQLATTVKGGISCLLFVREDQKALSIFARIINESIAA